MDAGRVLIGLHQSDDFHLAERLRAQTLVGDPF
jgi:hypothetical protein